jgi:hypothetical protein
MLIITFYFDVDHAVQVHDLIIEKSGGMSGINNPGQLESSLTHLQNDDYYPEFVDKLTYLIFALVKLSAGLGGILSFVSFVRFLAIVSATTCLYLDSFLSFTFSVNFFNCA